MLIMGTSSMLKLGITGAEWRPESAKSGSSGKTIVGIVGSSLSSSGKQIVGIGGFGPSLTLILGTAKRSELVKGLAGAVLGESAALLVLTGVGGAATCTSSSTFSLGRC